MNLLFRLLRVLLGLPFRGRLGGLDESRLAFRVWPLDTDLNLHMNNGRYLMLMDLGRTDLVMRCGLWRPMLRSRWRPVVGSIAIRYRRGLQPFRKFELRTKVLGWNEKWIFVEQRFLLGGEVAAEAIVKALMRGPEGGIPMAEVMAACGVNEPSPQLPGQVLMWMESEAAGRDGG